MRYASAAGLGRLPTLWAGGRSRGECALVDRYCVERRLGEGDRVPRAGTWVGEPTFFDRAPGSRPTLLFIHGGGWVVRDRRVEPWTLPFVREGWHVVTMTYRLGPGTAPQAVDDALCALQWVVTNADEYGFDVERIVVAGVSAGGHLALTTGILGSRTGHDCYPGNGFRVRALVPRRCPDAHAVRGASTGAGAPGQGRRGATTSRDMRARRLSSGITALA